MNDSIYPCLWFDNQAAEAADFYGSVFKETEVTQKSPVAINMELHGQRFMLLNGGPMFTVNPSISFFVVFETDKELVYAWEKLREGGTELMALDEYPWSKKYGWVQDRYHVSWQLSYGKLADVGQKFTPSLMFVGEQNGKAEEAIHFYMSIFDESKIHGILNYSEEDPDTEGNVKHAQFNIRNYVLMAMDSSLDHNFSFNEGISLVVSCKTQEEIDYFWAKLTKGGQEGMCGWLKDKYGVSWQIVPAILDNLMTDEDKAPRVMEAFLKMKKFDIETLVKA
ncbi:VOC family protein [Albibacterium indicum]|uniref:VOC family protein n=1 Tax=Albibacterium indicum TaxID=2292082 RepID=UPI000E48A6E6|nr:VOC family protein [Pedobacter indicus]